MSQPRPFRIRLRSILLAWVMAAGLVAVQTSGNAATAVNLVEPAEALRAMELEKQRQMEVLSRSSVFHGFTLRDICQESGITFQHQVVDDAGKHYKPVHYDHGNGLAVADVDGDGRLDVYFTSQLGRNELWRNVGGARFEDITEHAGVALKDGISVGAAFADIDNDGDPDLYVTTVRKGNRLFENQGGGRFRDISRESGADYIGHSSGIVFFDYDNDGRLDLFLCNVGTYTTDEQGRGGYYVGFRDGFSGHRYPERTEFSVLYRNLGKNRFQDVSRQAGLRDGGWNGDATFADLDQDRYPELYVLNMQGDDRYYLNKAGRRFVEATATHFPKTPWGAMGIRFFDFNRDGLMDLFVTDMHSDMTEYATRGSRTNLSTTFEEQKSDPWCTTEYSDAYLQGATNNFFGNAFYLSQGNGQFREASEELGAETFWPWGISTGDLNADGYEDAFVTAGMGFGFRYGINSVLLNERGERFLKAEYALGVEPRPDGRIQKVAFVLECSGADSRHPLCRGRSGSVPVYEALSSRSSAMFDMDDDGDLDVITLEMNDRPQVLRSDLSERRTVRSLKVALEGTQSNRDGLGARVVVTLNDGTITQYHDGKSGYFGQSLIPLYFGLGETSEVKSVEVHWPSGRQQVVRDGLSGPVLRIKEDQP